MKRYFYAGTGTFFKKFMIFLLFLILTCNKDVYDGMYWLSVHYSTPRIDPKILECQLISESGETSLRFESEEVFRNQFSSSDSKIISQYLTRNFDQITGQNNVLQVRYGTNGRWLLLDTLYIQKDMLINQDIFIGKIVLPHGDTASNYNAYEYNFGHAVDTVFIKK